MRLRITFSKTGSLRYTGHLDLQTVLERTIRRAGLPLAYTHGFHPGPKIQIASALPLGYAGRAEIVDIWLQEPIGSDIKNPAENYAQGGVPAAENAQQVHNGGNNFWMYTQARPWVELLQPAAPPGLTFLSAEQVDEHAPALQTQVTSAEYVVTLLEASSRTDLEQHIQDLLASGTLPRQRRGKSYDLRPLIEELSLATLQLTIFMRLAARAGATGRPEEVLDMLGISLEDTHIERTRLIFKSGIE
jgi:uncharacterized protein (DUF2344 family)